MNATASVDLQGLVAIVGPKGSPLMASGDRRSLILNVLSLCATDRHPARLVGIAKTNRRSQFVVLTSREDHYYTAYRYDIWDRKLGSAQHFLARSDAEAMDRLTALVKPYWSPTYPQLVKEAKDALRSTPHTERG